MLESILKKKASDWRWQKYTELAVGAKLPARKRDDFLGWLKKIWYQLPVEIIKNSFKGWAYVFEEGKDYGIETESESEEE